jgi:hypothetical protein
LYNYADDNTLSFSSPDYDFLISTLEAESQVLIDWFKDNKMQANPDKFQVLAVGKKTFANNLSNKILWGKQSKALERSIRTAET